MEQQNHTPTFGRCFASIALGLSPIFLIFGIAALFGADTVTFNGGQQYGIVGLLVAIILNLAMATVIAGVQKLGYIFLRFIERFRQRSE
ncbi:hypothetical protein CHH26_07540 [Qipengyuania flava]|uniref:hypothetical protein n=1 Tax=Qipengyuania flava TaxID=192812 RepID=UPI000B8C4BE3|nr:hypothetical protein [Qipengyuania flava]ASP30099.1 hypothetical protein CHH26_07540 [Qipengyuania flava]